MPWPEWGETDVLLTQMWQAYIEGLCPCGCGLWADDAHDPDAAFTVTTVTCRARLAIDEYLDANKDSLTGASLLSVRRLKPGETDPNVYDPDRARAAYEAHVARFGLDP